MSGFIGRGPRGPAGLPGADGKDGKDGADGKDGRDGRDGRDGVDGKDGRDGVDGKDGRDGVDGKDGVDGIDGLPGEPGPLPDGLKVVVDPGSETVIGRAAFYPAEQSVDQDNFYGEVRIYALQSGGGERLVTTVGPKWFSPRDLWDQLTAVSAVADVTTSSRTQEWVNVATLPQNPTAYDLGVRLRYAEQLLQVTAATHLKFYEQLLATQPGAVTQSLRRSEYVAQRAELAQYATQQARRKRRFRVEIDVVAVDGSFDPAMHGKIIPHPGLVFPSDVALYVYEYSTWPHTVDLYVSRSGAYALQVAATSDAIITNVGSTPNKTALAFYERPTISFLLEWYYASDRPGTMPYTSLPVIPLLIMPGCNAD